MMTDYSTICIDVGTGFIRSGVVQPLQPQLNQPSSCQPNLYGKWDNPYQLHCYGNGLSGRSFYVGNEVIDNEKELTLSYPMERGIVKNWDCYRNVFSHIGYRELKVAIEENAIVMVDQIRSTNKDRDLISQIIYEDFNISQFNLFPIPLSVQYVMGNNQNQNQLIIDCGYSITSIIPIVNGVTLWKDIVVLEYGGKDQSMYLLNCIIDQHPNILSEIPKNQLLQQIDNTIKHQHVIVSQDYNQDKTSTNYNTYQLYTFTTKESKSIEIKLNSLELVKCGEILFQPNLIMVNDKGIHEAIYQTISKYEPSIRELLSSNIILIGGVSSIKGLKGRLEKELNTLLSINSKVTIHQQSPFTSWLGTSIYSSQNPPPTTNTTTNNNNNNLGNWISKEQFEEVGSSLLNR